MLRKQDQLICIILLAGTADAILNGQKYTSPQLCRSQCVDPGGIFCQPFVDSSYGYCCFTPTTSPCDQNTMSCSSFSNDIAKYYNCPFDSNLCGEQAYDVTQTPQYVNMTSQQFMNGTLCQYQFRQLQTNNMVINVMVNYTGTRISFYTTQGTTFNSATNYQQLQAGNLLTANFYERIYLLAQSDSPLPDTFQITYYLTVSNQPLPPDPSTTTSIPAGGAGDTYILQNGTYVPYNSTISNTTQSSDNSTTDYSDDPNIIYVPAESPSSNSPSAGGTAIVIVIAVLIVMIPLGFALQCTIKKCREKNKLPDDGLQPLPDQSSNMSPDRPMSSNLYPFNHPGNDNENMDHVMQAIQNMGDHGGNNFQHNEYGPNGIQQIVIAGNDSEMIRIPVDQLPQFLQEMARNDPDMFQQLMANMDEEKLSQFIQEQELQSRMNQFTENLHSDMGLYGIEHKIDPHYIEEERKQFETHQQKAARKTKEKFYQHMQPQQIQQQQQQVSINLEEGEGGEQKLDFLVGLSDGGAMFNNQGKKKKSKKKKKKTAQVQPPESELGFEQQVLE